VQILEYFGYNYGRSCLQAWKWWKLISISSTISALFLCHCLAVIDEICGTLLETTSLDDVKTSSHAARHIISVGQSTVHRVFTLWLTKSHHFPARQTSLKQLGTLLMLHCIFWLEMEYPAKCKCSYINFCRSVYSRMMQQILPTGRHYAHYKFFVLYIVLYCTDGPFPVKLVRFMTKLL